MSNPLSGHIGVNEQFSNLAHVMEQMSKQTFIQDAKGKKIYDGSTKVYVKLGEK